MPGKSPSTAQQSLRLEPKQDLVASNAWRAFADAIRKELVITAAGTLWKDPTVITANYSVA
jgi:hypothetical protein